MSTYKGATPPDVKLDSKLPAFFERFYLVSDDPSEQSHLDYANSLTKDGTLIMGIKEARGYDAILEFRKGLWSGPVKKRLHTLEKIFPWSDDGREVMLYGHVDYGLHNGKDITVNWAGRAVMVEDDGSLKMKFYQVYLDSAAVANALKN
jgi:hypothetical protein